MGKEIILLGDTEFEKHKSPISISYVNIDRIVVSNKVSSG